MMVQRIYTGTGDAGETGLFGGGRVPKSDPRVSAYGTLDELNAHLGWCLTLVGEPTVAARMRQLQPDLFAIGAHLATAVRAGARAPRLPALPSGRIAEMESWIDEAEDALPELTTFVMPGGAPGAAALHLARTVARRAERDVVELSRAEHVDGSIIVYLNRMSDLLFVWARLENSHAGIPDERWLPDAE